MNEANKGIPGGPKWWRFDEYEVVSGTHIAPARGANLEEYDPFEAHEELWGGRSQDDEPPYVRLARVDPHDLDELVEWCTEFGLLGILPHRTQEVNFWPRWGGIHSQLGGSGGVSGLGLGGGSLGSVRLVVQESYRWGHGGGLVESTASVDPTAAKVDLDGNRDLDWSETGAYARGDEPPQEESPELLDERGIDTPVRIGPPEQGELLSSEELDALEDQITLVSGGRPVVRPGARILRIHSKKVERIDLAEGYAQFFPRYENVPAWVDTQPSWSGTVVEDNVFWSDSAHEALVDLEKRRYPLPTESDFLREYGEPIFLLRRYARQIEAVYDIWKRASEADTYQELRSALDSYDSEGMRQPFAEFRSSLEGVSPFAGPRPEEDGFSWPVAWNIPSLYAGLSLMMYQDFTRRGVLAKQCRECSRPFSTRRTDKKYCSIRCANRFRVRKHRKKGAR